MLKIGKDENFTRPRNYHLKNTLTKIKNLVVGFTSKLKTAEQRSKLEKKSCRNYEMLREEKKWRRNTERKHKRPQKGLTCVIGAPEGGEIEDRKNTDQEVAKTEKETKTQIKETL